MLPVPKKDREFCCACDKKTFPTARECSIIDKIKNNGVETVEKIGGEKFAYRLERAAVLVILVLALAFMLPLTASACLETSYLNTNNISGENIDIYSDNVFLNLIMLVLYLAVIYLFYKCSDVLSTRLLETLLFAGTGLFALMFIGSAKLAPPVYSDSYILIKAAMDAAEGTFYSMENYFARFPFQLGYVLYAELFFRVVFLIPGLPEGYYILALQCVNILWLLAAYYALLRITRLLWQNEGVYRLSMLLLFFSLPPVMSCTFLYGNIPAFACGTVAVWMFLEFLEKEKLCYVLLCALCLTMAVTLKLNLLIFLVAVGGIWAVKLVKKFSLRSCLALVLTVLCVLTLSKLPQGFYEKRSGYDFGEGIPMVSWLAMGMSEGHAAAGWYKEEYTVDAFKAFDGDAEKTAEQAKQVIAQRALYFLHNPSESAAFFSEKLRSQWNEPSYDSIWLNQVFLSFSEKGSFYSLLCEKGEGLSLSFMNQHQQIVFIGAALGLLALLKKRDITSCILPLIILGGFMYHLLFEAKSQYALPYFMLMMPLAASGLAAFFDAAKKRYPDRE